jgi:glutamate racemase
VGVIATAATFQGELFASLLDRYSPRVTVHTQVCPDLVPLIEAGELSSPRTRLAVQGYLAPLLAAGIDQLVLGCTHYPFLRPLIEEAAGPSVTIIDPAPAVARQAGRLLGQHGWLAGDGRQPSGADPQGAPAKHLFLTTGDPVRFRCAVKDLLGLDTGVRRAVWSAAPEPALEVARDE